MSTYPNPLTDYSPQMEFEDGSPQTVLAFEPHSKFLHESEELELAAEFLELEDEGELEEFLGGLFDGVTSALRKIANSSVGKAIVQTVGNVARTALPIAANAFGTSVGGPAAGLVAGNVTQDLANAIGLELEGLSSEDREFELARRFVRFAVHAIANALEDDPRGDPEDIAYRAATEAARDFAPGLKIEVPGGRRGNARREGRWIRHRDKIILLGV